MYLWNLVMIISLAFLGPQKQQPKDNQGGKLSFLDDFVGLVGPSQNNGPLRTGGPRAHYFRNALAPSAFAWCKKSIKWISIN
jgi:hypothetical protein